MVCPKHGKMEHIKTESNIDLGIKGLRHIEDHYRCTKCSLKGAEFTTQNDTRRKRR